MLFKGKKKKTDGEEMLNADGTMPLMGHLRELRTRIVWSFFFFLFWFLVCYAFRAEMVDFLKSPIEVPLAKYSTTTEPTEETATPSAGALNCTCTPIPPTDQTSDINATTSSGVKLQCHCKPAEETKKKPTGNLVFLSIPEVFLAELKTSFFISLFFSIPFMLLQAGLFIFPALQKKSEKLVFWYFTIGGYLFFVLGAVFGYYIVFPVGFDFFLSLARPGEIMPSISLENYLSFAISMLLAFGIVFELPLVVYLLVKFGLVTPRMLLRNTRFVLIGVLIVSAILTPPDPFSMIMMAVPLMLLYFLGIFFALFARSDKKIKEEK